MDGANDRQCKPYNRDFKNTVTRSQRKPFMPKIIFPMLFIALTLAACGEVEDTRPGQPVKTRQQAFKEIVKTFEPMGVMLRKNQYDADKFIVLADALKARRDAPWAHFGPDTNYPPSKATPAVWSQTEEFEKGHQSFIATTDALVEAAKSKDVARITAAYGKVHDTCQTCHKTFKDR